MARRCRIVVPGAPHHVMQRGDRRWALFSQEGGCALFRELLAERLRHHGVACWA